MRVLLVHPEDDPTQLQGIEQEFDMAFDLGTSTPSCYESWSELLRCPFQPLATAEFQDCFQVARTFSLGTGQVFDDFGFDWWDLLSIRFYESLLEVIRLCRYIDSCSPADEIFVSRSCFHSRVLKLIAPRKIHELRVRSSLPGRVGLLSSRISRLSPRKTLEVLEDKYDGSYRLRRRIARRSSTASEPLVLLPSAYGNASQIQLAYARAVPEMKFLLVSTRRSGQVEERPANVSSAKLAAYVGEKPGSAELQRLLRAWTQLLEEFEKIRELKVLVRAGQLAEVPRICEQGLVARDAWLRVFDSQPIAAVLCADEMNCNTRLPILIARLRGIPTIACHHGALDVRYSMRPTSADRVLVKGPMEKDYLLGCCGCAPEKFEVGAPPREIGVFRKSSNKDGIVFFSEPYENFGARCREFYAELLPRLADLAIQMGCELLVKLHPYESRSQRERLATDVLSARQRRALRVVDGPLQTALLDRARFALTITSTAAVDAALHQVPVFLCEWLNRSSHKYAEQFVKFRVAKRISSAEELTAIPRLLEDFEPVNARELAEEIQPQRLRDLFSGKTHDVFGGSEAQTERLWA